jgi:hypothetical protein
MGRLGRRGLRVGSIGGKRRRQGRPSRTIRLARRAGFRWVAVPGSRCRAVRWVARQVPGGAAAPHYLMQVVSRIMGRSAQTSFGSPSLSNLPASLNNGAPCPLGPADCCAGLTRQRSITVWDKRGAEVSASRPNQLHHHGRDRKGADGIHDNCGAIEVNVSGGESSASASRLGRHPPSSL